MRLKAFATALLITGFASLALRGAAERRHRRPQQTPPPAAQQTPPPAAAQQTPPPAAAQQTPPPAAQHTPPPYGPKITLETAKKVMAAAEAEAVRNSWPFVIAIIDSGGHLVMLQKSDQVQLASIPLAEGKAQTALAFKMPSKVLEDVLIAGGAGLRLTTLRNITPIDGGLPIIADGVIVGAIGVSGALSAQDALIARAGIEAVAAK